MLEHFDRVLKHKHALIFAGGYERQCGGYCCRCK